MKTCQNSTIVHNVSPDLKNGEPVHILMVCLHGFYCVSLCVDSFLPCGQSSSLVNQRMWLCAVCLDYCGRALERDPYYTKGLVFLRQIMKEQPSLLSDTKEMFAFWSASLVFCLLSFVLLCCCFFLLRISVTL